MDFEVTKTITTTTTIEKTTMVPDSNKTKKIADHSQSKKPRLSGNKEFEDFEEEYKNFHNWLQVMEKSSDNCKKLLETDNVKLDEKFRNVNELTSEFEKQRQDIDNVEKCLEKLLSSSGIICLLN